MIDETKVAPSGYAYRLNDLGQQILVPEDTNRSSNMPFTSATEAAKPVSMLSSDSGESTLNNLTAKFNANYPLQSTLKTSTDTQGATVKGETATPEQQAGKQSGSSHPGTAIDGTQGTAFSFDDAVSIFGNDFSGLHQTADGQWVADKTAYDRIGITGVQTPVSQSDTMQNSLDATNQQLQGLVDQFNSYNVDTDPTFLAQSNIIKSQYEELRKQMEQLNFARKRGFETLGYRMGTTQYAGEVQMGIEGEELGQANERIAKIVRDEAAAVMAARIAYQNNQYDVYAKKIDALDKIRDNKAKTLEAYNKTLADKAKQIQDQKNYELEVGKYLSDVDWKNAQIDKWREEADKPIQISPGESLYDSKTGKLLFTAPEKSEKPTFHVVNDRMFMYDPNTGAMKLIYSPSADGVDSGIAMDWATAIQNGTSKMTDIKDENLRNQVVKIMKALPPDPTKLAVLTDKIKQIDELLGSTGFDQAVGPYKITRFFSSMPNARDFVAGVEQLVSQNTLDTLINLKARGGTLGALSDQERIMLQNAATKISTWAVKDKNGNVKGYKISEDLMRKELNKIKELAQRALKQTEGETLTSNPQKQLDDYYLNNPDKRASIDALDSQINPVTKQPYTEEEKMQILGIPIESGDFNNDLSMSENYSTKKLAQAIKQHESGGNYTAKGGSGEYGAYQFMPSTWKGWAKKYLGDANAPMTPSNQDKVAESHIGYLLSQGNTPEQVALIWNGGSPVKKSGTNKFGIKYDTGRYAKNVLSIYNKLG